MTITKESLQTQDYQFGVFHYGDCYSHVERWRSNGKLQTWKRTPDKFVLPIKHGLYAYGYLTNLNAHLFHHESDCLFNKTERN